MGEGRLSFGAFVPGRGEGRLTLPSLPKDPISSRGFGAAPAQGLATPRSVQVPYKLPTHASRPCAPLL